MTDTAIAPAEFADLALAFSSSKGRADLALSDEGALLIDYTPATSMILSAGCDRRANADDTLPTGVDFFNAARGALGLRRGALADILDDDARLTGCRLWLLDREKQDDPDPDLTRRRAIAYLTEGFGWVEEEFGEPATVTASWARPGVLAWTVTVRGVTVRGAIRGAA